MKLGSVTLFSLFIFSLLPSQYGAEVYNITPSHPLAEGQTLVSPSQIFELGFFRPNSSANKYVGLWHKSIYPKIQQKDIFPHKVVWVANRDNPLAATDTLASLRIGSNGSLELVDGKQSSVWSTHISNCSSASLLDNGNFVVKDVMGGVMWETFTNPSDSLLPKMLLGYNSGSGKRNFLKSWKSENDPSQGLFLAGLSTEMPAQIFIWSNGSTPHWRSGPWDTSKFVGVPTMNTLDINPFSLVDNGTQGTRYFSYGFDKIPGDTILAYMDLSSEGRMSFMFSESGKNWNLHWLSSENPCDDYGACGPFGVCTASDSPICKCLKGFIPKSNEEWSKNNWTGGCVRRTNLSCEAHTNESVSTKGNDDGFLKLKRFKLPAFHKYLTTLEIDKFKECETQCLNNCSCLAYAYVDNIGCLVWFKDLIDMQLFPSFGEDLYLRLAHSELGEEKPIKLIASLTAIGFLSILVAIVFSLLRWRANKKRRVELKARRLESTSMLKNHRDGLREYIGKHDPSELKIYDFESILIATDNFSITNKLGQGGFGPVYKGMLPEGKEIAVKRLSSSSGQGVEEFKNEMLLIINLQHKNLVRMMGCCVKEDEKLLIYEFMPNKSLDSFLFDPTKREVLDWATRFNIIQGVARGLLYLHHDSYVKVIHRDLKVSNILLDEKMNPKISDFGLARIVEETTDLDNTVKVVGTRGYMSPEYAMGGIFSEKSDVYSFGVLVLEIISGIKNTSFYLYDQHLGFLAYAWKLWSEGRGLEFVSDVLGNSYSSYEVLKCMQIGLLCVQDSATDRPTMADVAFMLSSETDGRQPMRPVFTIQNSVLPSQPQCENTNSSTNEATVTLIEGR
uniref:G-type lectin S-receptor-like serine/threonine-protein kinase SD1-29 n=1 Tax=Fragaria vesca subsp. vesca TaxID=101020 RepID=UPI0005C84716|nr:PREDICTED: G-type lectin S-receptor-like serine/threonine-protein kinase SD1-29 [Fragaria vesca subsp. vesca]